MVLVLSEADVGEVLDLPALVPVVEEALIAQAAGQVERPDRPHFPVGAGLDGPEPAGTGIVMPAYIHGEACYATKVVGVHDDNPDRGLPTIHAAVLLAEARTGRPRALLAGRRLTNARTACIGALAVREFAPGAGTVGVLGAGVQARWQTRAIRTVADLSDVRIYAPSESREACAADLREAGLPARAVGTPDAAVRGADAVVTATTATEPVFPAGALAPGTLVVAVGAYDADTQELPPAVLDSAAAILADVPAEVAETGDLLATGLGADDLLPLGTALSEGLPERGDGTVVVESVGSATLDAAAASFVHDRASGADLGTAVPL